MLANSGVLMKYYLEPEAERDFVWGTIHSKADRWQPRSLGASKWSGLMDDGGLYIVLNTAQGGDGGGMTLGELREVSGLFLHAVFPLVSSQGINSVF